METILKVFGRIMECLEGICNDIECQLDSGCCHTHKQIHGKSEEETKNELKEIDLKNKITI